MKINLSNRGTVQAEDAESGQKSINDKIIVDNWQALYNVYK